jgi:hypothetical protein
MRKHSVILAFALFGLLAGCSGTPTKTAEKKEPEKVEPVTGQTALYRMYQSARTWATDVQVLSCSSLHISEAPDAPAATGAAPAWMATFVSQSKSQSRTYTYSVVEGSGNMHKGAFAEAVEGWSGPRGVSSPFLIAAVKVDTDAAYKTALEKAANYEKNNPGKAITYLLERTTKHPDPAWRVLWGASVQSSNFSVLVDASTGGYLETVH